MSICCRLREDRLRMMERMKRPVGEAEEGSGSRLTFVHLLQVKRREAEDDGEDEEGSGARLVSSSAAVLLDHIRPDLFQVERETSKYFLVFWFHFFLVFYCDIYNFYKYIS